MPQPPPFDLDLGAGHAIDRAAVPPSLRPLLAEVCRWGFDDEADRRAYLAAMAQHRPDEVRAFAERMDSLDEEITAWVEELGASRTATVEPDDEEWGEPHVLFLHACRVRRSIGSLQEPN